MSNRALFRRTTIERAITTFAETVVTLDPTAGLKATQAKTDGHPPWPVEWCDKFRAYWPVGTCERLDFDLLFWTGLRASDAVSVGRPHIKDGKLVIRAIKNRRRVPIPIAPELQASLDAAPTGDLTFLVGAPDCICLWCPRSPRRASGRRPW